METVGNGVSWRAQLKIQPRIRRDKETKLFQKRLDMKDIKGISRI